MRIAVLVIGLCLTMILGLQSCAVAVGSHVAQDQKLSGGGAVGLLVAFLYVLGSAFALGLPRVSAAIFAFAGVLAILVSKSSGFSDLGVWGGVAIVLAIMAYFGSRELRRRKAAEQGAVR